jgi:GNAT superfamily N-acetyltransferase
MHAIQHPSGHYTAAVLVIPAPGKTASFVLSPPRHANSINQAAALLRAGSIQASRWPIDLFQALLDPTDQLTHTAFLQAGFQDLAELHTMVAPVKAPPSPTPLPEGISLAHAQDTNLIGVLDATYERTLDCPALRGLRQVPDIIEGHRAGGCVHDDLWLVVTHGQRDIGCVLSTCTATRSADLAYFGLIPEERGRGLGRIIMEHVLARAALHGVTTMRLAVDASNVPARRLYRSLGFQPRAKQRAVIRSAAEVQVRSTK